MRMEIKVVQNIAVVPIYTTEQLQIDIRQNCDRPMVFICGEGGVEKVDDERVRTGREGARKFLRWVMVGEVRLS